MGEMKGNLGVGVGILLSVLVATSSGRPAVEHALMFLQETEPAVIQNSDSYSVQNILKHALNLLAQGPGEATSINAVPMPEPQQSTSTVAVMPNEGAGNLVSCPPAGCWTHASTSSVEPSSAIESEDAMQSNAPEQNLDTVTKAGAPTPKAQETRPEAPPVEPPPPKDVQMAPPEQTVETPKHTMSDAELV